MVKRRAREWRKMQTARYRGGSEMEGGQGGSTQISAFPVNSGKCLHQILVIAFTHVAKQTM